MKEKLKYFWYDVRRIPIRVRMYKEFLYRWFSYFKVLKNAYDFDYSSILDVEKHQITRVRDCVARNQSYEGYEYDIEKMNLALTLLEKIETGAPDNLNVNIRNAYRFNKNIAKELDKKDTEYYKSLLKKYLYEEKLWQLYYKLRSQYTRKWWD